MKYTDEEVVSYLECEGLHVSDYLVILGSDLVSDSLYRVYENVLFFSMMDDTQLCFDCIEYLKKNGQVYESDDALRKARPELIFS